MKARLKIILVEDNPDDAFLINEMLNDENSQIIYNITNSTRLDDAFHLMASENFDVALVDLSLPDSEGLDTYDKIIKKHPKLPVIALTGLDDEKTALKTVARGAQDYLVKGKVDDYTLKRAINYAIERHKDRQYLNHALSLLDATLEATSEGIIAVSNDNSITKINDNAVQIWNMTYEMKRIQNFDFLLSALLKSVKDPKEFEKTVENLKINPQIISQNTVELVNEKILEIKSKPQLIDGTIIGRVWSFTDITERIIADKKINKYLNELENNQENLNKKAYELFQINDKLQESEHNLKKAIESRDKFFSIIAHDLKSPFTTFLGITGMVLETYDEFTDQEKKEFIKSINTTAQNIFSLLENLLDWSRLQADRMDFDPEYFNIAEQVLSCISLLKETADNKGVEIINDMPESQLAFADHHMINTVLRNLISNAIKFTNKGDTITINQEYVEDEFVRINVKDTGVGITQENIKKLFNPENKLTTKGTGNEKGTGLGLVLCKELIMKNKGEIGVESEPEKGSEFYFTLPLKEKPAQ